MKLLNSRGRLTTYGFSCGYTEQFVCGEGDRFKAMIERIGSTSDFRASVYDGANPNNQHYGYFYSRIFASLKAARQAVNRRTLPKIAGVWLMSGFDEVKFQELLKCE